MGKVKILLLSAILVMCVGVMTGCGKKNTDDGNKASTGIRGSASEVITDTSKSINELETNASKAINELKTDVSIKAEELATIFGATTQAQTR